MAGWRLFVCRGIDWVSLVEMTVVHGDNFIPGTPSALCIIRDCTWARPAMRARTELFIPARDSVSLVSFSFFGASDERRDSFFPRLSSFSFFPLLFSRFSPFRASLGRTFRPGGHPALRFAKVFRTSLKRNRPFDFSHEYRLAKVESCRQKFYLSTIFSSLCDLLLRKCSRKNIFLNSLPGGI